jgi:small ligand-binding sensory domain FIST
MQAFLHSIARGTDWKTTTAAAVAGLGAIPHSALGFIYLTDPLASHAANILSWLQRSTPVAHWVGAVGDGIIGSGEELYDTPAISLMVTDFAAEQFRLIPHITRDTATYLQAESAWRKNHSSLFAVVHGDPRDPKLQNLVAQLSQGLEGGFLVGGLASSATSNHFIHFADSTHQAGLSGVLFAGDTQVVTGVSQGCRLIGRRHTVSEADGNVIIKLDGRPALDIFIEDIGSVLARQLNQLGGIVFAALPIPGSDTGDYLVRTLLGVDPDNKLLALSDSLRPGAELQFAKRDITSARADLLTMLRKVKKRLCVPAKGALYFSCVGRGRHLFGQQTPELALVKQQLGDIPITGFFANGEISLNRIYSYTSVLAVFQ